VQPCSAKLNLSLRVVGLRDDGYHDIVSIFARVPSGEALVVSRAEADRVRVSGPMPVPIEGENTVARALRLARESGVDAPPLDVEVVKTLYPGSGLGAGSGNAAALLRWLALEHMALARRTGADVPFLLSPHDLALVSGVGDVIDPLPPLHLHYLVVFPAPSTGMGSVGTSGAYARLDRFAGRRAITEAEAREEATLLIRRLAAGEEIGFLPNDFADMLVAESPSYLDLFGEFRRRGARAWGITGSGGAAFAVFGAPIRPLGFAWPFPVRLTLSV
jgi:4-diphosphocytidyl-2-C-methyl-D-erythritol kinase